MAMLAAPRQKQKVINLRAKNNAWSNDSNKFGQRMLEKMGWSEGKGLGANENGIVEHVVARYKNDDKGLGFEDRNDQWTKHEDDFNSLLSNLSGASNDEKLHSGVSLEVKSKKSKARVHYHKFTRGKDLTRYSEKDLANIFGKKSLKNKEMKEETLKEDVKTTEQVFTDKGSMVDYFKSKLAAFKSNNNVNMNEISLDDNDGADCGFKGFSGAGYNDEESENNQTFGFQGFSCYKSQESKVETDNPNLNVSVEEVKKSKKKKKRKQLDEESAQCDTLQENTDECNVQGLSCYKSEVSKVEKENSNLNVCMEEEKKTKKKKKRKHQDESPQYDTLLENTEVCSDLTQNVTEIMSENVNKVKKSKKKKKEKKIDDQETPIDNQEMNKVTEVVEEHNTEDYVPKKKKKRKNKDLVN